MTRRGAAISRAFALALVLLIVSPFTAPFATFDLTVVEETTGESKAVSDLSVVQFAMIPAGPHWLVVAMVYTADLSTIPVGSLGDHTVLRL